MATTVFDLLAHRTALLTSETAIPRNIKQEREILWRWPVLKPETRLLIRRLATWAGDQDMVRALDTWEQYVAAAVSQAVYKQLEDGQLFGSIPALQGVWATGPTEGAVAAELPSVVEGWLSLRMERRLPIPPVGGIDLSPWVVA